MTPSFLASPPTLVLLVCSFLPFSMQDGKSSARPAHGQKSHEAQPGPLHEKLMKLAGTYTTATKFTLPGGGAPMESSGVATFRAVLGGRFLLQEDKSEMFGQPFETLKYWGYNAGTGQYEGTWSYTGSTAMMRLSGKSSDGGRTITCTATYEEDAAARPRFEIVLATVDDDHLTIKLVGFKPDGGRDATMETVYTRKK